MKNILNIYISGSKLSCGRPPLYDTQAYIFTWLLLLQAYLSMTHTVCKHVKATHTHMYRRFEHVLSKLGRVEKTERLNSTASSTSDVSCRSNPDVPSYSSNTNMSSKISSMFYGVVIHNKTWQLMCVLNDRSIHIYCPQLSELPVKSRVTSVKALDLFLILGPRIIFYWNKAYLNII
jgi:hypothetical protein